MFSRKKTARSRTASPHVLRGRDNARAREDDNPLARRFLADDEPDTIDLDDPSRFHAPPDTPADSPTTEYFEDAPPPAETLSDPEHAERPGVLSRDAETGKFYVLPGQGDAEILLNDHAVRSPTELRPGDRISVGVAEFRFLDGRGQSK
jgi:hypothetical protein